MSKWFYLKLAGLFGALSGVTYFSHYLIFHDVHHILIYLIGDLGFMFLEVLLITLVFHDLLSRREKRQMLEKLNMVIGAFFSEVGTDLLKFFSDMDPQEDRISKELIITKDWTDEGFTTAIARIKSTKFEIDPLRGDLPGLQKFMKQKREFLLRLLENPNLLEHEMFTDVLWAVFHLGEELSARKNIEDLGMADVGHITGDIGRAYGQLIQEWLEYMLHLKTNYPYLFSLALRTNPFDPTAHPEITE
jgi:hypothetical protein